MVERRPWTAPRVEIVGRGYAPDDERLSWPYEAGIHFDDPARPIYLGEGSKTGEPIGEGGSTEFGGFQALQSIREAKFAKHVKACGCEWLVAMAEEEEQRGLRFTPEEIFQRWQQLSGAGQ